MSYIDALKNALPLKGTAFRPYIIAQKQSGFRGYGKTLVVEGYGL
jgi:hypothetical protein